jgi:hypothetical protein
MINTSTNHHASATDWRCPPWCPTTDQEHADVSDALDDGAGGASHLLPTFTIAGLPAAALVETEPDGSCTRSVLIAGEQVTPSLAREFALAVIRAADLVEFQA